MEEIKLTDYLNDLICNAYSANFMVLQQSKIARPDTDQMVFTASDIFKEKSFFEEYENSVLDAMVEFRNEVFNDIDGQLKKFDLDTLYVNNTTSLIDYFNERSKNKLSYEKIFPSKRKFNYKNIDIIRDEITNGQFNSDEDKISVIYIFNQFIDFYEDYKTWITDTELIQAIKDDIGQYGNKTFSYGNPDNPNIVNLDKSFIVSLFEDISQKLSVSHPELFKKPSKKQKEPQSEDALMLEAATEYLYSFYDLFNDRFEYANLPYVKNKEGLIGLAKKIFVSKPKDSKLVIDKIYAHKNELNDLARVLEYFPELAAEREKVQSFINEHSLNNEKILNN